jgi:thiol-disulfide isomerase/thioredoxin
MWTPIVCAVLAFTQQYELPPITRGKWDAWLDSPGGELHFGLEIDADTQGPYFALLNGSERILHRSLTHEKESFAFAIPAYDSRIDARFGADAFALDGEWSKRAGPERVVRLPFHARYPQRSRTGPCDALLGRWSARFESSADPAVAILEGRSRRIEGVPLSIEATFLTTLGDYRYLAGTAVDGSHLELACFDGAHAFLFKAELKPDGSLEGDFWSGDRWHETWTAVRDERAQLPDPFGLTKWNASASLASIAFPDLDGKPRSLAEFAGRARMLVLFGSWCPNCNDEAAFLRELDQRYRARGLSIVGLAFELTGDAARDAQQVKLYAARHQLAFPLLLAGTSDKASATQRFPLLDKVRAYPTTVFLHGDGRVRAVHQGYSGPATGAEHAKLREDFERLIEDLLTETPTDK